MGAQKYFYKARNMAGVAVRGQVDAEDEKSAKALISQMGLVPVEVGPSKIQETLDELKDLFFGFFTRVPAEELLIFTQQLQTIYSVGIPLIKGLSLIREQTENKTLVAALDDIIEQLSEGLQLHEAFRRHPRIFSTVYCSLVEVGETSGQLEPLLERIYTIVETQEDNRSKVKSALFYPKMVAFMITVVVGVMAKFVVPKMTAFYDKLGGQVPGITTAVVNFSEFVTSYFFVLAFGAGAAYYAFHKFITSKKGRLAWDSFKLKVPIFGPLLLEIEMNSFCVVMELLLKSGVEILKSFEIIKGTLTNQAVVQDIEGCQQKVKKGAGIGESLQEGKVFPGMLVNLIRIGEESGAIDRVLHKIGRFYKMRIDYKFANLSKAIEPLLLAIIFSIVGVLSLAIFLPIWKMSSAVKRGG
ncbi:MAG: type II secretion system F family protein [Bdellovibrionales bacterium]